MGNWTALLKKMAFVVAVIIVWKAIENYSPTVKAIEAKIGAS